MLRAPAALVVCLISALAPATARAQEDERAARVYGIFKTHCFECHGESRKSALDPLWTHDTLIKGGMSGPVIVAHQPEKSRLVPADLARGTPRARCRRRDHGCRADQVAAIRQWIEDGGSLDAVEEAVPDERKPAARLATIEERPITPEERQFWAFQPPQRVDAAGARAATRVARQPDRRVPAGGDDRRRA